MITQVKKNEYGLIWIMNMDNMDIISNKMADLREMIINILA